MDIGKRKSVEELVYRSCLALDGKDYKAFLALCDEEFLVAQRKESLVVLPVEREARTVDQLLYRFSLPDIHFKRPLASSPAPACPHGRGRTPADRKSVV